MTRRHILGLFLVPLAVLAGFGGPHPLAGTVRDPAGDPSPVTVSTVLGPAQPESTASLPDSSALAPVVPDTSAGAAVTAGIPAGATRTDSTTTRTLEDSIPRIDSTSVADSLSTRTAIGARADSVIPDQTDAVAAGSPSILLISAEMRDPYGLLAAWQAGVRDSATIQPFRFSRPSQPDQDWILYRLYRRAAARYFVREQLGLRPDYFMRGDSLAATVDARSDSLEQAGVAAGVLYRFLPSGGMRYLPPPVRSLAQQSLITRQVSSDGTTLRRRLLRANLEVGSWVPETYAEYLTRLSWVQARRVWHDEVVKSMKAATVKGGRGGLVRVSLPFEMPKAIKSIFGEGKPNLSVSGSERISFGGRSQWFPYQPTYEFQRKPSKFPQLEMEQDLTIRLKGTIGDKLDVDVDQSSEATTSLANRIQIHYKGYEDEIIRQIDLGNTTLRLPGTEYVSYGGAHTGLFGINAEAQLGDVTLNTIVSKEEGETGEKSTSIRSQQQSKRIYDYEYVKDRFFFLDDPTRPAYSTPDSFVVRIRQEAVRVYLDDGDGPLSEGTIATSPGFAVLDLNGPAPAQGATQTDSLYFVQLEYGTDYTVLIDDRNQTHPILIVNRYLDDKSTLGVTYYDEGRRRDVGGFVPSEQPGHPDLLYVKMIRPATDLIQSDMNEGPWGPTNHLMLKNVYPLQQSLEDWKGLGLPENSILPEDFELIVHYKGTIDGVEDPDEIGGLRLLRLLGLDYYQQTDAGLESGQDGQVDRIWVDFTNGYLFFPDLEPFAPRPPGGLRGRPGSPATWDSLPEEHWNTGIYDTRSCARERQQPGSQIAWTSRFYLEVAYRTPVTELRIDALDLIEGSEVVTVGGRRLARDRDYRIDYQSGVIRLFEEASVSENEEIKVTYKHAGGFGTVSKTLLGAAAFYKPEDSDLAFSTSWLYERRGSPDRRPRLGSEPTQIAVGEFAGRYARETMGLTHLLDQIPFVDARRPSKVSIEGGLGISMPNPNTRNDLYIDDFEGVADDIGVRLNRLAWKASGIPVAAPGGDETGRAARAGEIWWYTPYRSVQEGEINPTLDYQEANDYRSVLELQVMPYDGPLEEGGAQTCPPESSWAGIVQGLSQSNLDLTRARFLDIWVNDFVPWEDFEADSSKRSGTMYVELGRINEDAIWTRRAVECETGQVLGGPLAPPNRRLDSEDSNSDGQLDLGDEANEDTGLDRWLANDPADSTYDDYRWTADEEVQYQGEEELCEVYGGVNGTERNGRLDSEDLDGDNGLDQENSYFQFRFGLGDLRFVETDVRRDYAGKETGWTLGSRNGWRRIRLPLSEAYVDAQVNNPSWDAIKQIRIWFTGLEGRKRIQIGAIDIRSNRWVAEPVTNSEGAPIDPDTLLAKEEDFFPGVISNKENSDVYSAPFEEHRDRDRDNVREREQSLTLELRNFQPGHVGRVFNAYLRDQDYMGYEFLEFWVNSTLPAGSDVDFFLRLCKDADVDSTDYYEYRIAAPVITEEGRRAGSWLPIKIRLSDLSGLKAAELPDSVDVERELSDGGRIRMRGHPYLTKIRRITVGVVNQGDDPLREANVWVNELRLTHVFKDVDIAGRVQVRTELSDLGNIDFSFKRVGADFTSLSGGGFRARKETETSLALSTSNLQAERFLPRSLGLRLPFGYQYNRTKRVPKYRTNDDLLVEERPTDRDVSETISRNYSLSVSRNKTNSGLLKYTLDAFTLSGSIRQNASTTPFSRDSSTTRTFSANYSFPFGTWGDLGFYKGWKLHLVPTSFSLGVTRSENEQVRYRRENGDLKRPFEIDLDRTIRSGGLTLSTGLRPIKELTYTFAQSRDLMLRQRANWLGGVNIGRETSRQEDLGLTYQLRLKREWFEPRLTWKGNFRGNLNQQGNASGGEIERSSEFSNSRTTSVSADLPVTKLLGLLGNFGRSKAGGQANGDSGSVEPAAPVPVDGSEEQEKGATTPRTEEPRTRTGPNPLTSVLSVTRTSGTLTLGDRSAYSRVRGEPSLAYQLGLSMRADVERLSNWRESQGTNRQIGIESDFKLLQLISGTARFQDNEAETRASGTLTGTRDRLLPELELHWGDLTQRLGVRKYLRSVKAETRLSRREKSSTLAGDVTRREVDKQFGPLINLELTFKSGFMSTLKVDRGGTHTEDFSGTRRVSDRTYTRIQLTGKRSLNITREMTVPLKKSKERITTKLDLSLTARVDLDRNVSNQMGSRPQVLSDLRKIDISLGGTYQFSRAVSGRAAIDVGENADRKTRTRTSRYVGVNLSAAFTF